MAKVLIRGSAGFSGYHLAKLLLDEGFVVHGYDGMTTYYDLRLKQRRHAKLPQNLNFAATEGMLEDQNLLDSVFDTFAPDVVVHLAALAGVRCSLENPRAHLDANVIGAFNLTDASRRLAVARLPMASTPSVCGANDEMPFSETEKADTELTLHAAARKATESTSHILRTCGVRPRRCSASSRSTARGGGPILRRSRLSLRCSKGGPSKAGTIHLIQR